MSNKTSVTNLTLLEGHPYIKAVVNLVHGGMLLRGIRLEKSQGQLTLGFPGRKVRGHWQVVFEASDPSERGKILDVITQAYEMKLAA